MAAHDIQRDRFRDSLRDALDGVDVDQLQSQRPMVPANPTAPLWSPTRPTPRAPQPKPELPALPAPPPVDRVRADVEAAMAPLLAEIAALRAQLGRERRAEMVTLGSLLFAMLITGVVLALVLHR